MTLRVSCALLGLLLHTNLRLKLDENKRPMVYPYYRNEEDEMQNNIASMKQRGKRELEREVIGYVPRPEMNIL